MRVDTERVSVNGEETLEITWVGASGVYVSDVKDCSCLINVRKGRREIKDIPRLLW